MNTVPEPQKRRLQAHFGFTRMPFRKDMQATEMFDSRSQRELLHTLLLWLEIRGIALISGPAGVGKSITIRRFIQGLDASRYRIVHLSNLPTTPVGFLRSLCRALGLPMRQNAADLFDQAHEELTKNEEGIHPLLVLDDAEGLRPATLDLLRRLTPYGMDAEDRFSILLTGTEELLRTFRDPGLESLVTRVAIASCLKPFTLEDTRNYVGFHLRRSGGSEQLFSEEGVKRIFQASQGKPRRVNQLCLQVMVQAAVLGLDTLTGDFVAAQIAAHPLYEAAPQ